jgi:hypothetical protein
LAGEEIYKRWFKEAEEEFGSSHQFVKSSYFIIIIMGSISKELPVRGKTGTSVFGSSMKKDFMLDPEWRNMNHGT